MYWFWFMSCFYHVLVVCLGMVWGGGLVVGEGWVGGEGVVWGGG